MMKPLGQRLLQGRAGVGQAPEVGVRGAPRAGAAGLTAGAVLGRQRCSHAPTVVNLLLLPPHPP
jgi:hypothetical protein